jgi:hypothetical protein
MTGFQENISVSRCCQPPPPERRMIVVRICGPILTSCMYVEIPIFGSRGRGEGRMKMAWTGEAEGELHRAVCTCHRVTDNRHLTQRKHESHDSGERRVCGIRIL